MMAKILHAKIDAYKWTQLESIQHNVHFSGGPVKLIWLAMLKAERLLYPILHQDFNFGVIFLCFHFAALP